MKNISIQGQGILENIVRNDGEYLLKNETVKNGVTYFIGNTNKAALIALDIKESRFIDEDIDNLCALGFLNLDYSSTTHRFTITRKGYDLGAS